MASVANSPSPFGLSAAASNSVQTQPGPDVTDITTEGIGFQAISGETKLRLLPSPWPSDNLPAPTASLLSVASKKGILAAAGPESVVIGSTDSVRRAYASNITGKLYDPQVTLNLGIRISQVAFSANEEWLVLSAENGGGLAVYEVETLMQGATQPALELSTNGTALRALLPNPAIEKGELFAVITMNGQLMIANLRTRQFVNGVHGQLIQDGVSCTSWSKKGTQLLAGLGDGSCCQLTPDGQPQAKLPPPPGLQGEQFGELIQILSLA